MKSKVSSARKKEDKTNVTFQQLPGTFFSGGQAGSWFFHDFPASYFKRQHIESMNGATHQESEAILTGISLVFERPHQTPALLLRTPIMCLWVARNAEQILRRANVMTISWYITGSTGLYRICICKDILPLDWEVELEWERYHLLSCLITGLK